MSDVAAVAGACIENRPSESVTVAKVGVGQTTSPRSRKTPDTSAPATGFDAPSQTRTTVPDRVPALASGVTSIACASTLVAVTAVADESEVSFRTAPFATSYSVPSAVVMTRRTGFTAKSYRTDLPLVGLVP